MYGYGRGFIPYPYMFQRNMYGYGMEKNKI